MSALLATTAVQKAYDMHLRSGTAIAAHLPRLRLLAGGMSTITEFGVKRGASSSAFLLGLINAYSVGVLTSYDVVETPQARALALTVGEERWRYRIQSSLDAPREPTDLLFVDSLHTYDQTRAELERHADSVAKLLIFHDTMTFGCVGADGESGKQLWDYGRHRGQPVPDYAYGIRPAVDQLMMRDSTWRIMCHHLDSHGLLVLERRA